MQEDLRAQHTQEMQKKQEQIQCARLAPLHLVYPHQPIVLASPLTCAVSLCV